MAAPTETTAQHKLQCGWSVYELRESKSEARQSQRSKNMAYSEKLFKLCTFRTVEEFWGYWNRIPKPSQALFDGFTQKKFADGRAVESYAVFKEGITPEWEDPANKTGSEWSVRKELTGDVLDECWDRLVLGAIGETFDSGNEITGVRVIHKNRKDKKDIVNNFRFEIWLRTVDRASADKIRGNIMDVMNPGNPGPVWQPLQFSFKNH